MRKNKLETKLINKRVTVNSSESEKRELWAWMKKQTVVKPVDDPRFDKCIIKKGVV